MFHPRGLLFSATCEPSPSTPWPELSQRLRGPAIARFSGALFKKEVRHFEVLGLALRFSDVAPWTAEAKANDQDLLFATILSPFTLPFSPFTTRSNDFLANHYWAVSPFEVAGVGRLKFRITPIDLSNSTGDRRDRKLRDAVEQGGATLTIEARPTMSPGWQPLAIIRFLEESSIDQEALRFDPFRDGRGIVPAGIVHSIRRNVYSASQRARPSHV